jgi:SDR family mycofactocin-dependent oxidoreductase
MGRVEGKVAFITGAARGQGRSHAVRLAAEGADIIALDVCGPVGSNVAPSATPADLVETVRLVESLDRRIVSIHADVRDYDAMTSAVAKGVAAFGHLDIVCANAGIVTYGALADLSETEWRDMIDVQLTGSWQTCKAVIPQLVGQGKGGSIILTSSVMGLKGGPHVGHYAAAKHGVVGMMKTLALELAPHMIRVNTVNPTGVDTDMIQNRASYDLFAPDLENATREQVGERLQTLNALPVPWVESVDVSNAVLFLASDEARYITGVAMPIDAGALTK